MEDAVLVVVERDPAFLRNGVEALAAGFVPLEGAVRAERLHRVRHQRPDRLCAAVRSAVQRRGVEEFGSIQDLRLAQGPAVVTQQHRRGEPGRGERGSGIDSRRDTQPEVLHQLLLLVSGGGLRVDAALAEQLGERDRLAGPDRDPAISPAQDLRGRE